jgi:predicted transcriptional regulator
VRRGERLASGPGYIGVCCYNGSSSFQRCLVPYLLPVIARILRFMKVRDEMVKNGECVGQNDTVAAAEKLIKSGNVASVTVLDHTKVVGTLSTAGIATQMPALERSTDQIKVGEIMDVHSVFATEDEEAETAHVRMRENKLSSISVLDHSGKMVGVLKLRAE